MQTSVREEGGLKTFAKSLINKKKNSKALLVAFLAGMDEGEKSYSWICSFSARTLCLLNLSFMGHPVLDFKTVFTCALVVT